MSSISLPELSYNAFNYMLNNMLNKSEDLEPKVLILQILEFDGSLTPNYYFALINDGINQIECLLNPSKCLDIKQFDNNCMIEVKEYLVRKKFKQKSSESETQTTGDQYVFVIQDFRFLVAGSVVGRELQYEDYITNDERGEESDGPEEPMDSNESNQQNGSEGPSNANHDESLPQTPDHKRARIANQTQNNSSVKKSSNFTLIKDLSADGQHKRYNLKGKIVNAYPIEKWENLEKSGTKLSFTFSDNFNIIRCTAWNEVCDEIKYTVQSGHYVIISGATVNNFSSVITLNLNSGVIVTPFEPNFKYKGFVDFKNLKDFKGQKVDIIGVINDHFSSKRSTRKDIRLRDKNNYLISVTLENKTAEHFGGKKGDIIAIKNALVINPNCIKSVKNTNCIINPKAPEASLLL